MDLDILELSRIHNFGNFMGIIEQFAIPVK